MVSLGKSTKSVFIREVWATNAEQEFDLIKEVLPSFNHVAIFTQFPGPVSRSKLNCDISEIPPLYNYGLMRVNVNSLKIIQVGLVLSNYVGSLPDLGTESYQIWQFNFNDFDIENDQSDPATIKVLQQQRLDFAKNKKEGMSSGLFRNLFLSSGLLFNLQVRWVTFHGYYHFGYMIRILTGKQLPVGLKNFMSLVSAYFRENIYDMRHMIKFCDGLKNVDGLEDLAKKLNVDNHNGGKSYQAGYSSLLTLRTFLKLRDLYVNGDNMDITNFQGILFGLQQKISHISWLPPLPGWTKINVDGSVFHHSTQASCGGIFRNHEGHFQLAFMANIGRCSVIEAELEGILIGLSLAQEQGFLQVIIETDSLLSTQLIRGDVQSNHSCAMILNEIKSLMMKKWNVKIQHSYREANSCADALAKQGHSFPLGLHVIQELPSFIFTQFSADKSSTPFNRVTCM